MKKLTAAAGVLIAGLLAVVIATSGGQSQSATGSVHPSGWGATPQGLIAPRTLTAIPTAAMYDAVDLSAIPSHPYAVAGYVAGSWPTWFKLAGDFPAAHRVSIAIHLGEHAMCGDFEPGDMDPSTAGTWARQDAGFGTPCQYGDLSNMPAIESSDRAAYGAGWRSRVLLWLAWYRGTPGLVSGYDAVQWSDNCLGRSLDCDTVSLRFLEIASPPYVPPPVLPWCYTHRRAASVCAAVKAKVASDLRAAASSQRALTATNAVLAASRCVKPYRRSTCRSAGHDAAVFAQRVSYFNRRAALLRNAN